MLLRDSGGHRLTVNQKHTFVCLDTGQPEHEHYNPNDEERPISDEVFLQPAILKPSPVTLLRADFNLQRQYDLYVPLWPKHIFLHGQLGIDISRTRGNLDVVYVDVLLVKLSSCYPRKKSSQAIRL
jgi:hypothetical protein